jgi:heme-degrading monooxygenase HmoA
MSIATTPKPPYYAVIFSNELTDHSAGYAETADRMVELAKQQPGYLGFETARDGLGISVSYWADLESIKQWKAVSEHLVAQKKGKDHWYKNYKTRIALVERDYGFER